MYWFARLIFFLVFAVGSFFIGCKINENDSIVIFAPSSMMQALEELSDSFDSEFTDVVISYGGSNLLAHQIIRGANPDIFIAAGTAPMDLIEHHGLTDTSSRFSLISNRLVIVGDSKKIRIADPSSLQDNNIKRIAVADPKFAPSGLYTQQFFNYFQLESLLESRLIYGMNVRDTLEYVSSGNADVGIVYQTDAINNDLDILYLIPEESHLPIYYPVSILENSKHKYAAWNLIKILKSEKTSKFLSNYGFSLMSAMKIVEVEKSNLEM